MRIYLIRHSSTIQSHFRYIKDDNNDLSLTVEGQNEIRAMASRMKKNLIFVDEIYVSPLKRAIEAAKITFSKQQYTIIPEFAEINKGFYNFLIDNPDKAEMTVDEWEVTYNNGEIQDRINFKYPSGITVSNYISGITKKFLDIIDNTDKSIAIFSHNGSIKAILTEVLGGHKDVYYRIEVKNSTYSEVEYNNGLLKLKSLNC